MDIIVAGCGGPLAECRGLLQAAGFSVGNSPDADDRCPVILGEGNSFGQALQLVEAGRHVLLANPTNLGVPQLSALLAARKPRQALMLWCERRQHPAYRLASNLTRSDEAGWRPRYLRLTTFTAERPTSPLLRWRLLESLAVVLELAGREPKRLRAHGVSSAPRASLDFLSVTIDLGDADAFLEVGLGEGMSRREALLAASERKAYVDELDPSVPVRLVDDTAGETRRVSCPSPGPAELARQQCLAFLEAASNPSRCRAEADLWLKVAGCWQAVEGSLANQGELTEVREPVPTGLRVYTGRRLGEPMPAPRLRVVG